MWFYFIYLMGMYFQGRTCPVETDLAREVLIFVSFVTKIIVNVDQNV